LFAVCDGHGTNGHHVSKFLKCTLAKNLEESLQNCFEMTEYPSGLRVEQEFKAAFKRTNDQLNVGSGIDTRFSGSTCVGALTFGNRLYIANVGDSRAVLIKEV
jgi:serine/threonine protein phosphatase PrpC